MNQTLVGHLNSVYSLVVLPNGQLVSAGLDKIIIIWDPITGLSIRNQTKHANGVSSLALLPNGLLASGSYDKTIKIWNAEDGTLMQSIESGYSDYVYSLAVLKSGLLASAGFQQSVVKIWSVEANSACNAAISTTTPNSTPFVPLNFTQFPISGLYSFGALSPSDIKLPKSDDASFGPIPLSKPFSFGDQAHSSVYVSPNGFVSFVHLDEYLPFLDNGSNLSIIAPLFNDFDTKKRGDVFYRETTDNATLSSISGSIKTLFKQTPSDLVLSSAFIATWSAVPLYGKSNTANTFQLVIASYDNCFSYLLFLYQSLSSQPDFKAGYYADLETNGQVASGVIEALLNSGSSTGYAFKVKPGTQCDQAATNTTQAPTNCKDFSCLS
jgi:hypothetical protein